MKLFAGTSGFSYDSWHGEFYPEDLPASERLAFYAARLPAVEVNNTFYRLPKRTVLEAWAEQVPPSFELVIKASRRITHFKRLKDAAEPTAYLLETTSALGARRGPLLFQLHPAQRLDLPRLQAFLELIPQDVQAAFQLQHPSWRDESVFEALRGRDCAWVVADDDRAPVEADADLVRTASWGYLRLRRADYDRTALSAWVQRLRATGWQSAHVFFKHEEAGAGAKLALELIELHERAQARKPPLPAGRRRTGEKKKTSKNASGSRGG